MKIFVILLLFMSAGLTPSHAQQDHLAKAKADLEGLYSQFNDARSKLDLERTKLTNMTENLQDGIPDQVNKVKTAINHLNSIIRIQRITKDAYTDKVSAELLEKYFPDQGQISKDFDVAAITTPDDKAVYMLFGDKKIPKKELLIKDEALQSILSDVLVVTEETCLGTFEIPGHRQKIELLFHERTAPKGNRMKSFEERFLYFEEVKFSIREGMIYDLRVRLTDREGITQVYFENRVPISLLSYNSRNGAETFKLYHVTNTSLKTGAVANEEYKNYRIAVSDILSYFSTPGNNFVPDDVEFTFPIDDEIAETRRRVYIVNQNNSLQHIMELRTYTDFLGLFDDAPNGIVQVEGKADFYIAPFQLFRGFPQTLFKKVSPYVHFTRFDDDYRNLTLIEDEAGELHIKQPLEIIEKSYLDMGMLVDFYGFSLSKHFPFNINLYGSMRYQIASIVQEDDNSFNFKTIGTGFGLRIDSRRLNNFGFILSPELTFYNHLNRFELTHNPKNFWVFRNEAEIFYYPGTSKSQSIFLRLRTFMNRDDGEDSFFQLQFGYRFAIGMGNIKGKS